MTVCTDPRNSMLMIKSASAVIFIESDDVAAVEDVK
jgi:hypothetical protein